MQIGEITITKQRPPRDFAVYERSADRIDIDRPYIVYQGGGCLPMIAQNAGGTKRRSSVQRALVICEEKVTSSTSGRPRRR